MDLKKDTSFIQFSLSNKDERDKKNDLTLDDLLVSIVKAIREYDNSRFISFIPEYVKQINSISKINYLNKRQCYLFMDALVFARMRESLRVMLKSLPPDYLNDDVANYSHASEIHTALNYVYHAYPVNEGNKIERLDLIDKLIKTGAKVSLDFTIMSIGENEKPESIDAKTSKTAFDNLRPFLNNKMTDVMNDILNLCIQYPFSNPETAFANLLKSGIKPKGSCLRVAFHKPELPYATMLLNNGVPVSNTSIKVEQDQLGLDCVKEYARRKANFCIAYYENKISPFLQTMQNPIYSGRSTMDGFTVFLQMKWLTSRKEGFFTSEEEINAKTFIFRVNDFKKTLDIDYQKVKSALNVSVSEELNAANKFMTRLSDTIFNRYFVEIIPTKNAFDSYLQLLDKNNWKTKYNDYRDDFSCLDPNFGKASRNYVYPRFKELWLKSLWLHPSYKKELVRYEKLQIKIIGPQLLKS